MLSSVLRSPRAVEVNIAIMRTFVQLRRLMDSNRDLARKIEALEKHYDEQFATVFDAIKRLIAEDDIPQDPTETRHRLSESERGTDIISAPESANWNNGDAPLGLSARHARRRPRRALRGFHRAVQ